MAIPISYNLRNLVVRKTTTIMTALGIGLTVAVLLAVVALVDSLGTAFESTSNPLHVLVMRKGSTSELSSNFTRAQYQDLRFKSGIARTSAGEPMASLEVITVVVLEREGGEDEINVSLRGVTPVGIEMRDLKLAAGRWFQTGRREIVVGKSIADRFPAARMGGKLKFGRGEWDVVGIMDGGRSAFNSEIWVDLNQMSSDFNRSEVLSSALVRATDSVAVKALINDLTSDTRLNVKAQTEKEYYDAQKVSAAPIQFMGLFVSAIMAVGSSFAAMNTMYAAVARRAREVGTLRVLGFSRGSILVSFFLESVLLSVIGGLVGCLLVMPLNNSTTGIGNFVTFSEIAFNFQITPLVMSIGVGFAVFMGAVGGLFPARMAAKKEILTSLREI